MTTAIPKDADNFDATEAFMTRWKDAEDQPSDTEGEIEETNEDIEQGSDESRPESDDEGTEDDDEGEVSGSEETDDQSEEEPEGEDDEDRSERTVIDSDDAIVKIKVDGKEVEASLKDLKRLYGQEASLTRKSQETAEIRKRAEEAGAYHVAGLESLYQRAVQAAEPYKNINFLALSKDPTVSQEEITALWDAAQGAFDNVKYLEGELGGAIEFTKSQRQNALMVQAKETVKVLSDPEKGIPGWSEPLYNDIREFAIGQGLDRQIVDEIVDPVGIKILHMAMKYAKGAQAVSKGPKKVDKTPKKIIKGAPTEVVRKAKTNHKDTAIKKLKQSGSTDDAAEAFLARWQGD
jgi:hypothetical protein